MVQEPVVSKANYGKQDCQHSEAHELNRLASNGVDKGDSDPIARNCSSTDKDQITHSSIVEDFVHAVTFRVANGTKDDGVVEAKAIESDLGQSARPLIDRNFCGRNTHIEEEPRACRAKKDLSMLPLPVVTDEVAPTCLWDLKSTL